MNPQQQDPWQQQPQPQQQYSVDYLDQISAPVKQRSGPGNLLLIIFGLLGVLVVVGIIALLLSGQPSTLDRASQLSARMETLLELSKDQHPNLRDNDLRSTNTAYTIFLTNAVADLEAPLEAAGIEKNVTQSIEALETQHKDELTAEFDDARLNVVLDRTYTREMSYQLDLLQAMMRDVYQGTSSEELRGYLDSANSNLAPIAESFDEFAGA